MRTRLLAIVIAAGATTVLSQDPAVAPPSSVRLPPELARVLTDYEAGWRAGDGAALAELFVEDGYVLPNGAPPVSGRAAIRKYYGGPGGALVLRAFAFATEGSTGYILGAFSRRVGEPDVGKFTLTLRKGADGQWRIVSDMDNGNRRPATPTPTPAPGPSGAL
jgi:ketosteroid isomerase-like protein